MDDYNAPDVAAQLALMVFVTLWGFLSCSAALRLAVLGS
jgi:hypothetical protein